MRRISILLFVLVVCFAAAMQAQTQAPKPDPALKKLHVFVGHWTYEGEYKAGPLGPGGKMTGEQTIQMILGGFFLQSRSTEKGPMTTGEGRGLQIYGYDPVNKNFTVSGYGDDGSTFSAVATMSGNTVSYTLKSVVGEKQQIRGTYVLAADLMSFTWKAGIAADGNTWIPGAEAKYIKTKPAPKK